MAQRMLRETPLGRPPRLRNAAGLTGARWNQAQRFGEFRSGRLQGFSQDTLAQLQGRLDASADGAPLAFGDWRIRSSGCSRSPSCRLPCGCALSPEHLLPSQYPGETCRENETRHCEEHRGTRLWPAQAEDAEQRPQCG